VISPACPDIMNTTCFRFISIKGRGIIMLATHVRPGIQERKRSMDYGESKVVRGQQQDYDYSF